MLNNTEYMRIKQSLKGLLQQITSKEISLEDGLDKFQSFINVPGALDKHEWKYEKYNTMRRDLKKHFGNEEIERLFKPPAELWAKVKRLSEERERDKLNQKLVIDFPVFMNAAIKGLQLGIQHKIYPQVLFCLSCLVCSRPNDMNGGRTRKNGQVFSHETAFLHEKDGILSLIKKVPSKQKDNVVYPPEITPFLCDPEHYNLCKSAFEFLQDNENIERDCYSLYWKYKANEPCGPCTQACQWRKSSKSTPDILECMFDTLGFNDSIIEASGYAKAFRFTPYDARRFTASAYEQGRCQYGYGTRKKRKLTVNSVLGHASATNADEQYLTMEIKHMQTLELTLQLAEFDPYIIDDGIDITKGAYLVAKKLA